MITGSKITAPNGYRGFSKEDVYYFLQNDAENNCVRLVQFIERVSAKNCNKTEISSTKATTMRTKLLTLSSIDFEEAIEDESLVESPDRENFPPWLDRIKGISIAALEDQRVHKKESYLEKVDRKYAAIAELIPRAREILSGADPDREIGTHGRRLNENTTRVRLWFYTYIVFGRNKWALMDRSKNIGHWNRDEKISPQKLGRPSKNGCKSGFHTTPEMKELVLKGYKAYKSKYKSQNKIYRAVLTNMFGCVSDGNQFYHPQGKPFPSRAQYRRCVTKHVDPAVLLKEEKGPSKARELSGEMGSFSAGLQAVHQRVEFDGYYVSEKLTGVAEGSVVNSFCVVRAVCVLSGQITGIGFAREKETMEAYKMCLFSMAMDKVRFAELFGVKIHPWEWPCLGLAGDIVVDRGPASGLDCLPEIKWLSAFELPPPYSGQSKASVESSHPRDRKNHDQPAFFHSSHIFTEVVHREILRVLKDNRSSNATRRMEDLYAYGVEPTPHGVWSYYSSVGRDLSVEMPFDDAVRSFLSKETVVIKKDAVYLYGRKYSSQSLVGTGIFNRVARGSTIKAEAYVLNMCVRSIWIELHGQLHELYAMIPMSMPEDSSYLTLEDLKRLNESRKVSNRAQEDKSLAVSQHYEDRLKQAIGKDWDDGRLVIGQPKKSAASIRDSADQKKLTGVKK